MGTNFSPRVPEASLSWGRECLWAALTSGGSLAPMSPLGSLWETCFPAGGHGSMSPSLLRLLGSLFFSQGSWEHLRQVSLGPTLFPGKGAISETPEKGCFWPSPHLSHGGVSALQHFGMRLGISELSFLLGALGYLSFPRAGPLEPFLPWVGAVSGRWEGLCWL